MPDTKFDFNVFTAMQLSAAAYRLSTVSNEGPTNFASSGIGSDEYNRLFDGSTDLRLVTDISVVDSEGFYVRENAAALISRTDDALIISFRGTNDNFGTFGSIVDAAIVGLANGFTNPSIPANQISPDVADWFDLDAHWALLADLIAELPAYTSLNGINKVVFTGHSLGGGMVQQAMIANPSAIGSQIEYSAFAFAPPGINFGNDNIADPRLLNIIFENDPLNFANLFTEQTGDVLEIDSDGTGSHDIADYLTAAESLLLSGLTGGNRLEVSNGNEFGPTLERVALQINEVGLNVFKDTFQDGVFGSSGDDEISVTRDLFRDKGFVVVGLEGDDEIGLSSGEDFVVYRKGDGADTVEDFNPSEDTLVLYGYSSPLDVQISSFNVFPFNFETTVNFGDGDSITFKGLDLVEVDNLLKNNLVIDDPTGSEIQIIGLDSDGPLQSTSAPYLDGSDNVAGTIGLSAPTFMGDGDVEYTVSLSGIGQGLQYNIAYIIDVSGSMGGQRIFDARNAYIELTNQLKGLGIADVTNFAVIPFNSGSTLFADLTADEAIARVSSLGTGGGTSFGPALSNAQTFFSSANTGQTNIAYFLSDGQGSGASDFLTNIANVQAFGIGSGANLGALNIIDSDNAISLTSSSQLTDVLTGSGTSVDEIDGIAISVDGNVVDFITPDQLVDGPLGLQYTGTISGLDISSNAQNQVSATVFLKGVDGAKGSTALSIASAFGDTTVTQSGDEAQVVLSAFDTSYNADDGGTSNVNLLANNLNNEIIATNTGGTFSLYDGDDYFQSSQTAGSTIDRVIDGGDGYDIVEYLQNYAEGFVEQLSGFIRVGFNSDTLSNVEEIRFADTILITETFQLIPRTTAALIEGTADRDNLVGTDADEIMDGKGGNDVFTGNGGADTFKVTGQFPTILDFTIGEDRLDLTEIGVQGLGEVNFRATANGLKVGDEVSGTVVYLKSVTSDALPEDSFVFAATEDLTVVADDTGQRLFGRAGNDTLISGAGRDRMTGNEGDDTFVMNGTAIDVVTDFDLGNDLLDVSAWGVTAFDELRLIERSTSDLIEVVGNGHRARLLTDETNLQLVDLDQSDFILA